jgi:flagellin-like protein
VSEVVSTLLLVAIVVSLGVLVFTFASGGLGSLTGSFTGLISNQGNAVAEHIVVEQVAFCFTTAQSGCNSKVGANVYVRNVGTISSSVVSVFIVDQSTSTFIAQVSTSSGTPCSVGGSASACSVPVGTAVEIPSTTLTNGAWTPSHGHTYSFTITSQLGNSVEFIAKAT